MFTAQGLELYCRFSKETTTVLYTIRNLQEAIASVENQRRQGDGGLQDRDHDAGVWKIGH